MMDRERWGSDCELFSFADKYWGKSWNEEYTYGTRIVTIFGSSRKPETFLLTNRKLNCLNRRCILLTGLLPFSNASDAPNIRI
jgi:hypothetical protein